MRALAIDGVRVANASAAALRQSAMFSTSADLRRASAGVPLCAGAEVRRLGALLTGESPPTYPTSAAAPTHLGLSDLRNAADRIEPAALPRSTSLP